MVEALQIQALQIANRSFRPKQADAFPSFVRERVGLRSGGISLRFFVQAEPKFSLPPSGSSSLSVSHMSHTNAYFLWLGGIFVSP
jgi:hypothetical protein